jgi:ABC-type spermidine/putrescine transport system permease subunit II
MYNFDRSLEEAAMNLGANEIQTFLKITLPSIIPGVITAAVFSFIIAFTNLQLPIFLQGPGMTPIPVKIYSAMQFGASPAIAAVATINIIIVLGAVVAAEYIFDAADAIGYT